MTQAELYKRRNNRRPHVDDNNKQQTKRNNSIDRDLELIRANTTHTPTDSERSGDKEEKEDTHIEEREDKEETEHGTGVRPPVHKTYAKHRTQLDNYVYVDTDNHTIVDHILDTNTNTQHTQNTPDTPVPRKRRKLNDDRRRSPRTRNEPTDNNTVTITEDSGDTTAPRRSTRVKATPQYNNNTTKTTDRGRKRPHDRGTLAQHNNSRKTITTPQENDTNRMQTRAMRRRQEMSLEPDDVPRISSSTADSERSNSNSNNSNRRKQTTNRRRRR